MAECPLISGDDDRMVQVIAHRGARSLAPENTLAAARAAHDAGADAWETDVQMTGDGHLILHHDRNLSRCTSVAEIYPVKIFDPLVKFTLEEISQLDAGSYYLQTDPFGQISQGHVSSEQAAAYIDEKIPTLDQALEFTHNRDWTINLELKYYSEYSAPNLPEKVLEAVAESRIDKHRVVISSFYHPWLDFILDQDAAVTVHALLGKDGESRIGDFQDFRFDVYNLNALLVEDDQIRLLKQKGKQVNLFTINDRTLFNRFSRMEIDGVFTDFPQRFIKNIRKNTT